MDSSNEPLQEPLPTNGTVTAAPTATGSGNGAESLCGSIPRSAWAAALASFAQSMQDGRPGRVPLPEDIELVIRDVASNGDISAYPWEDLRVALARKLELVLVEFWEDVKDVQLKADVTFTNAYIRPLTSSLMKPVRDGAPFTVQRLCELLSEPHKQYRSTRKYLYAVQRMLLIQLTEEEVVEASNGFIAGAHLAAAAVPPAAPNDPRLVEAMEVVGQKRKLPPELQNGTVEIEPAGAAPANRGQPHAATP
jgi:serine/threonine-protein phosphatase 4 regulatory subunit 2